MGCNRSIFKPFGLSWIWYRPDLNYHNIIIKKRFIISYLICIAINNEKMFFFRWFLFFGFILISQCQVSSRAKFRVRCHIRKTFFSQYVKKMKACWYQNVFEAFISIVLFLNFYLKIIISHSKINIDSVKPIKQIAIKLVNFNKVI